MIQIDNTIVSFDLIDKPFLCDLEKCKGACCVEGDSGAPLTNDEADLIEKYYPIFEKFLDDKYRSEVQKQGFFVIDNDGDKVTPIFNNKECVYTFIDDQGVTRCAIEKAFLDELIDFRKPISCHLFPIRIKSYADFDAVNYQEIDVCKWGRACGASKKLMLYQFLKEPLIRKYGVDYYEQLVYAAENLPKEVYSKR